MAVDDAALAPTTTISVVTVPIATLGDGAFAPPVMEVAVSATASLAAPPATIDDANTTPTATAVSGPAMTAPEMAGVAAVGDEAAASTATTRHRTWHHRNDISHLLTTVARLPGSAPTGA